MILIQKQWRGKFGPPNEGLLQELTQTVLTEDGWFKTGDLAVEKKGRYEIKGRLKNVIVGSTGENIYPEEIEMILNQSKLVLESCY